MADICNSSTQQPMTSLVFPEGHKVKSSLASRSLRRLYSPTCLSVQDLAQALCFFGLFSTNVAAYLTMQAAGCRPSLFWYKDSMWCLMYLLTSWWKQSFYSLSSLCSLQLVFSFVPSLTSNGDMTNCPIVHFNHHQSCCRNTLSLPSC